jgi:cyclin D6
MKQRRGEEGFMFEAQTINKMELVILDTLNWRMRSITPFSFLHFFVSLVDLNEQPLTEALKSRASEVIFNAHNGKIPALCSSTSFSKLNIHFLNFNHYN